MYEHWLFYGYPVASVLLFSAYALIRLLRQPGRCWSLVTFSALGCLVLMRGTFHLLFFVGMLGGVVAVRRLHWRDVLTGALIPTVAVFAVYAKHYSVFGQPVIGGFYRDVNSSMMQMSQLEPGVVEQLQATRRISRSCPGGFHSHVDLLALLSAENLAPTPRGIAILDSPWKSTGATNWNSTAAELVGRECGKAGAYLRTAYPDAYPRAVWQNALRYWQPADRAWPFLRSGTGNNADKLRWLNRAADRILGLQVGAGGQSITVLLGLLCGLLAPLFLGGRRRGRAELSSERLLGCFVSGTLFYTAAIAILFSTGDHNRYRAEVMPLVWVIDAAAAAQLARRLAGLWRAGRNGSQG